MIKLYDSLVKDAMLAHLELLTIKAMSYLWVSIHTFHKFITKQVELGLARSQVYTGSGNDLFLSFQFKKFVTTNKNPRQNSVSVSGNHQQAVPPTVPKACRTWNYMYIGACECDQQDTAAYKEYH